MAKLSARFQKIYEAHRQKVAAVEQDTLAQITALLDELDSRPAAGTAAPSVAEAAAPVRGTVVVPQTRRKVEVIRGDITTLALDAIVNPASRSLQGGGGIEGRIFAAGGQGLVDECHALGGLDRGEAKITRGHDLPVSLVIHTVGPVWKGGDHGEAETLAACYRNSLELAAANGVKTIAFPAISTGNFGYPLAEAARVAVTETVKFADASSVIEKVYLVCWDEEAGQAFTEALQKA